MKLFLLSLPFPTFLPMGERTDGLEAASYPNGMPGAI